MNKIILSLLLTTALAVSANAQNCVNSSRCDELGYNKKAENCIDDDILKCPFDAAKVYCKTQEQPMPTTCLNAKVGDILYSDKTCSSEYIAGKTPIAVIFAPERRLAVALDEFSGRQYGNRWNGSFDLGSHAWQKPVPSIPDYKDSQKAEALQDFNGKSYTYAAYNFCYKNESEKCIKNPSAIKTVYEYSTPGTAEHDWYLPALGELNELLKNFKTINQTLSKCSALLITEMKYYLSSCEGCSSNDVCGQDIWVAQTEMRGSEYNIISTDKSGLTRGETIARPILAY